MIEVTAITSAHHSRNDTKMEHVLGQFRNRL
ncbi:hypothetical protein RHCRD62_30409 [Rhodococcus sp. RD6.2]|nr:hypothetical protein RHCRD62_30409 [Rhodococcus sp. RD6.2]